MLLVYSVTDLAGLYPFFPSPCPRRGLGRGFTQREPLMPECRNKRAGVLALNLSRRDRNRADLSSDK
jgi:hypothetical protein